MCDSGHSFNRRSAGARKLTEEWQSLELKDRNFEDLEVVFVVISTLEAGLLQKIKTFLRVEGGGSKSKDFWSWTVANPFGNTMVQDLLELK